MLQEPAINQATTDVAQRTASSTSTSTHRGAPARSAADTERSGSAAIDVLLATLPFTVLLAGYVVAATVNGAYGGNFVHGVPNDLGFPLRMLEPIRVDTWVFGRLPTAWLQEHLYLPGRAHWYDAAVAVVYFSHFVVGPAVGVVLWFRNRARFRGWATCALLLAVAGLVTYVTVPTAPPWMAAEAGATEPISRISDIGWDYLGLGAVVRLVEGGQGMSNPVAAMPSLHVGYAALIAAFFFVGATLWRKVMLVGYALMMSFAVVYSGEHYVADVAAGVAYAVVVVVGWRLVTRTSRAREG